VASPVKGQPSEAGQVQIPAEASLPKKGTLSLGVFWDATLSQIATSLPVYLVVILVTSHSSMANVFLISALTFSTGLAVSLTRAWLSGSIAIQSSGEVQVLLHLRRRFLRADVTKCVAVCMLIIGGFALTTDASAIQVFVGYLVCLSSCLNDYHRQLNFAAGKSRMAMKIDMTFIAILAGMFAYELWIGQIDYLTMAMCWALTTWMSTLVMYRVLYGSALSQIDTVQNLGEIRRSLLFDFLTGFGVLQLIYLLAPVIASQSDSATLRLALIATGPSAVMAQAFTVSGLTMIMSNPVGRLKRLSLAGGLIFGCTFAVSLCLLAASPTQIETHLGSAWLSVRPLAFCMLIMSLTHGISIITILPMRWEGKPDLIVKARLLSLPANALAPALGLYFDGVQGCLLGLSFSNVCTWLINGMLLRQQTGSGKVTRELS